MSEKEAEKDEIKHNLPLHLDIGTSNVFSGAQDLVIQGAFITHRVKNEKSANELESLFNLINVHLDELVVSPV